MLFTILFACTSEEAPTPTTLPAEEAEEAEYLEAPKAKEADVEPTTGQSAPPSSRGKSEAAPPPPPAPAAAPEAEAPEAEAPEDAKPQLLGDSNVFHSPDDQDGDDAPPQLLGDSNVFSGAEDDAPSNSGSALPGQVQTNTLLSTGILAPLPSTLAFGTPLDVTFNTLYPNGCWRQSDPSHTIEGLTITHSYTTSQVDNQICTMAMVRGGFATTLSFTEPGTYTGRIIVDGTERTQYTITVTPAD